MKPGERSTVRIPQHLGFIPDGNRRWAADRGVSEFEGHAAGYRALREVIKACFEQGVPYVSVYAFSNENWQRGQSEVGSLMQLALQAIANDLDDIAGQGIRCRFLGRRDHLPADVQAALDRAEAQTAKLDRGTLALCFNYGGQQEIIDAVKQCIKDGIQPEKLDEAAIASRLYGADIPPLDMVVRTSGEKRISNFMLWRVAYSELFFLDKHWPDMTKQDVAVIIDEYNRRSRRFGK